MNRRKHNAITSKENPLSRPRVIRDILLVDAPILLLAAAGSTIGLETLSGGALVNLGYMLAIIVGAALLQLQGSSWRNIGLSKPASWWKAALKGMGTSISAA